MTSKITTASHTHTMATCDEDLFPFFKLPPKLRNRIYELAYARRLFNVTDREITCKGFKLPYTVCYSSCKFDILY